MMKLEQLQTNAAIRGIVPDALVTVVSAQWFGTKWTSVAGHSPDGPALRRPSPIGIDMKGRQPQQPVLVPAPPPTVTLTRFKPGACGTLAPRASGARAGWARYRSKTSGSGDLDDFRRGLSLVARRTSRIHSSTVSDLVAVGPKVACPQ